MSILSITFHTIENQITNWELYTQTELSKLIDNLQDVEKYILSDVDSGMLNEGKNTNLLLVFKDDLKRNDFIVNDLMQLEQNIASNFGDQVMVFPTLLNPIKKNF